MVYFGVDVGGTGIKVGLISSEGEIINKGETPTLVGRPYEDIISDMATCMFSVLKSSPYSLDDVGAIGIGIPGIADEETGIVINCTNMKWYDIPLKTELQKYINKPIYIQNDATIAGYAESICGISKGTHSSVFITLGTGVGGGIVINGRPWSGFHGVGSEIGHIPMDIAGEPCSCGNYGCLERYCSATAIIRMGKQMVLQHHESLMYTYCNGDITKLTAKMIIDAAKELDEVATSVFNYYADYLARAMYTIIAFLDPEMIVIGGGISKAGSFLLDAIVKRVPNYLLFKSRPFSRIELAKLGADAGIIGAGLLGKNIHLV